MTNVTNPTDYQPGEVGNARGYGPGHAGLPPQNQVVINDAAGSGLGHDGWTYKAAGQFGCHLAVAPPAGLTVNVDLSVAVNPGNGVSVSPSSLAFTSGNFSSDQLVTITGTGGGQSMIKAHIRGGGGLDADIWVNG